VKITDPQIIELLESVLELLKGSRDAAPDHTVADVSPDGRVRGTNAPLTHATPAPAKTPSARQPAPVAEPPANSSDFYDPSDPNKSYDPKSPDIDGIYGDLRIHSKNFTRVLSGQWKPRRNTAKALVDQVVAEQLDTQQANSGSVFADEGTPDMLPPPPGQGPAMPAPPPPVSETPVSAPPVSAPPVSSPKQMLSSDPNYTHPNAVPTTGMPENVAQLMAWMDNCIEAGVIPPTKFDEAMAGFQVQQLSQFMGYEDMIPQFVAACRA
jgi:hypothetical protein